MGRVPTPTRIQDGMARRFLRRGLGGQHEPHMPVLRPYRGRESQDTGAICLCRLRIREQCRPRRRDQRFRARTALVCLWRDGAVGPPVETGTRRSNRSHRGLDAVGILVVHGGEDVKLSRPAPNALSRWRIPARNWPSICRNYGSPLGSERYICPQWAKLHHVSC